MRTLQKPSVIAGLHLLASWESVVSSVCIISYVASTGLIGNDTKDIIALALRSEHKNIYSALTLTLESSFVCLSFVAQ